MLVVEIYGLARDRRICGVLVAALMCAQQPWGGVSLLYDGRAAYYPALWSKEPGAALICGEDHRRDGTSPAAPEPCERCVPADW